MNCRLRRVTTCQCMVAQNKAKNVAYNMITFSQNQAHKDENEKVLGNNVEGGRIASGPRPALPGQSYKTTISAHLIQMIRPGTGGIEAVPSAQ